MLQTFFLGFLYDEFVYMPIFKLFNFNIILRDILFYLTTN